MAKWQLEQELMNNGFTLVGGCDEVGRGPLAGPVVAAVTVFKDCRLEGLRDSKRLADKRRRQLSREICAQAVAVGIGVVQNETIDRVNILEATRLAMLSAWRHLHTKAGYLLIDAVDLPSLEGVVPCRSLVRGDQHCASIAAASIIAKVYRDKLMQHYHRLYPMYGFAANKGYPTAEHRAALQEHGPSPIHRRSFNGVETK
ncbi:MAG: ribonuclease HII [Firmicutes bacterium]|nr:ribonuclease HII [Bacillota bacterium]